MIDATNGPGNLLRAEREALGVTVREVADTLNLSITVVQALEADDYPRLPGTVFARGYIRSYARLLDLDPVPLLELYPSQANGGEAHPVVHEAGVAEWIRRRPGFVLSLLAALLVAVLFGLATLIWPEEGIESILGNRDGTAVTVPPADSSDEWGWTEPDDATQSAGRAVGSTAAGGRDVSGPAPGAPDDPSATTDARSADGAPHVDPAAAATGAAAMAASGSAVVEGVAEPGGDGRVRRLTATGEQRLRLDFSADSWVEIRDPGGVVLYSNLNKAGADVEMVGQGPFRILLGYAPGVTLEFEGEPVALAPHTRNNVATLVLGQ